MSNTIKTKTPAERQELCDFINKVHKALWSIVAAAIAVGAVFYNPGHLVTAALVLLFSRAEWTPRDLETLE